jgi:pilin isopeptide linkage protein/LPXTG-motif cell wall-anchored protein
MPDGSINGSKTMQIAGDGTVSFGQIIYTNIGEYHYTVSEAGGGNRQYTYSSAVYSVSVLVTWKDAVGGDLEAVMDLAREGGIDKQEKALFISRYKAPGSASADSQIQKTISTPATDGRNNYNGSVISPKTGDTANPIPWIILMAVSAAAVILAAARKKKNSHRQKK